MKLISPMQPCPVIFSNHCVLILSADGVSEEVVVDGTLGMGDEEDDEDEDEEMEDDRVEEVAEPSEERKLWLLIRDLGLMDQFFCEIKSSLDNLKNDLVSRDVREEGK